MFHCFSVISMAPAKRTDRIESQLKAEKSCFLEVLSAGSLSVEVDLFP